MLVVSTPSGRIKRGSLTNVREVLFTKPPHHLQLFCVNFGSKRIYSADRREQPLRVPKSPFCAHCQLFFILKFVQKSLCTAGSCEVALSEEFILLFVICGRL